MNKKYRGIALLLMIVLLTGLFFSYHVLMEQAHHDCTGEDCPICSELAQAVHFISQIKFVSVLSFFMTVLSVFTLSGIMSKAQGRKHDTLISLKVELLN